MLRRSALAAFPMLLLAGAAAHAGDAVLAGPAAFGDWRADAPGTKRLLRPGDMPAPYATRSASNGSDVVARPEGAAPRLPPGFSASLIASGLENPRALRVAPNGDIFIADSKADRILVLRPDGDRRVAPKTFATGLNRPFGMAFYPPGDNPAWLYVANTDGVVRFPYGDGQLKAQAAAESVVSGIPSVHHWTRDIAFSPDGGTLFLSVGSGSNVAEGMGRPPGGPEAWASDEPLGAAWGAEARRADVLAFDPDGRHERVFATGLRNCAGLAVQPQGGVLWCAVNERDGLGDDVPFEYATSVAQGRFYGWPWYYIGANADPRHKAERPDLAGKVTVPDVLMQAHSAPLGIAFYDGAMFPPDFRGDAFVTLHGSWNRGRRTGYKVVRLRFRDGRPSGVYEDFMTGFVLSDAAVWGRPVGVAVARDGALIVGEDGNGTIWRVTYATQKADAGTP